MAQTEMLTIKRGYDFSKWLLQHTGKFPKSHRFSVAAKLRRSTPTLACGTAWRGGRPRRQAAVFCFMTFG
jgi:hypothetical protein